MAPKIYASLPSTQSLNIVALITLYWMCSEHNSRSKSAIVLFPDDNKACQWLWPICTVPRLEVISETWTRRKIISGVRA